MKDRAWNVLLLIIVIGALALSLFRGKQESAAALSPIVTVSAREEAPDPLNTYRERRDAARRQEEAVLTSLVSSEYTASETRGLAEALLIQMTKNAEAEAAVEAAMTARGYPEALCAARDGEVNLFLPREISGQDAALFLEIAMEATNLPAENIRVTGWSSP